MKSGNPTIEKLRKEELKIVNAIKQTFSTPNGQTTLKALREEFCDRSSIVPGDPYATHANEGAREVVLYIENILNSEAIE